MNRLIMIVGASGVGKTTLTKALAVRHPFNLALEEHTERPFQGLFKQDPKFAFPNQIDYLVHRAQQEYTLRQGNQTALADGGLDLDFHGFTRLFHARGWLSDAEFDLCSRLYSLTRSLLPPADLIVSLRASSQMVKARLASRSRINIAGGEDADRLAQFIEAWLQSLPPEKILRLDTSDEGMDYPRCIQTILKRIETL